MLLKLGAILAAISSILFYYFILNDPFITQTPKELNPQYDYIIVGAGSAGCVLAARLSKNPDTTVLLLEAGNYDLPFSHVPALVPALQKTAMDWQFKTVKQANACFGTTTQTCNWPRGKTLGGTSVLNYMIHAQGFPHDYNWGSEWQWSKVKPFFHKLENMQFNKGHKGSRGAAGPIEVRNTLKTGAGSQMLKAVKKLGYPTFLDYNNEPKLGFGYFQLSVDKSGKRSSTVEKYLKPAMKRFNLHVVRGAHVTKINFNEHKSAIGLDYIFDGKIRRVLINKEIILSAGAIQTPQIMILSGIGPKQQLNKFNIDPVVESEQVGKNLKDHMMISVMYKVNDTNAVWNVNNVFNPIKLFKEIYDYIINGAGLFSWPLAEIVGFWKSGTKSNIDADLLAQPDLQYYLFPVDVFWDGFFNYIIDYTEETLNSVLGKERGHPKISWAVSLLHPESSGTIELNSKNALDAPKIDPKYLTEKNDAVKLREGLKSLVEIVNSGELSSMNPKLLETPLLPCIKGGIKFWSDEYLDCLISYRAVTIYHPSGTSKIGQDIRNGVVDQYFRVFGVSGLRIVDASVFPNTISGNTNIPTIMIAERAAHWISGGK